MQVIPHKHTDRATLLKGTTGVAAWAQRHLGTGTRVVSDGLACFHGVTAAGCVHEPVVVGSGKAAVERPEFRWVNTILGNIKNALRGTYHAIRPKYAQRYLSEFEYRFNRRFDLPDIIPPVSESRERSHRRTAALIPHKHTDRATLLKGTTGVASAKQHPAAL